jgi:cytochrome c554/c'-like protein
VVAKNSGILKAYDDFPVDVVNVSSYDLRFIAQEIASGKTSPLFSRLVSANISSIKSNKLLFRPFIVRELSDRSAAGKKIRIAFIGLTDLEPAAPPGLRLDDPITAATGIVAEARKQADLVIALAHVKTDEALRLAGAVPDLDVIIAGNTRALDQVFTPPTTVGRTLVIFTPYETRMLGELRFYRGSQTGFATKSRFISLDDSVPDEPGAKRVVAEANASETAARETSKSQLQSWSSRSATPKLDGTSAGSAPHFISAGKCAQCHVAQYVKWSSSPHAHATDPLPPRWYEFEMSCLKCHATGSAEEGKFTIQSVHCEGCHGPGSEHASRPSKGYGRVADLQTACTQCHTAEVSPNFNADSAWQKIKH